MSLRALLLALSLLAAPAVARADDPSPAAAPSETWQDANLGPMTQRGEDGYASTTLVTTAYGFIWLMVAGFVGSLWLRSRKVERDLAELARRIGTPVEKR